MAYRDAEAKETEDFSGISRGAVWVAAMSKAVKFRMPRKLSLQKLKRKPPRYVDDEVYSALDEWEERPSEGAVAATELAAPHRPTNDPRMSDDVTKISSRDLGTLHARFVAMCEWLDWEVAKAVIDSASQDAFAKHVLAEVRLRKSGTVADKDAKALKDERYIKEEIECVRRNARAKLLRARLSGYERCAAALSREISRRDLDQRHE